MMRRFTLVPLFCLLLAGCGKKPLHPELAAFINREYNAHPKMELADLYKILYQAEFGPEQMMRNPEAAMEYLRLEAQSRGADASIPLTEECSPDGSMIRVNLAPFVAARLSLDSLFAAMRATAATAGGSGARLRGRWKEVGELVDAYAVPFSRESYQDLTRHLEQGNYPETHHSREYTTAYRPAYRVVRKSLFEKYFPAIRAGANR